MASASSSGTYYLTVEEDDYTLNVEVVSADEADQVIPIADQFVPAFPNYHDYVGGGAVLPPVVAIEDVATTTESDNDSAKLVSSPAAVNVPILSHHGGATAATAAALSPIAVDLELTVTEHSDDVLSPGSLIEFKEEIIVDETAPQEEDLDMDVQVVNVDALDATNGDGNFDVDSLQQSVAFLKTKYGNRLASLNGHCYSYEAKSKKVAGVTFWKCVKRKLDCKARLHLEDAVVVSTFSQHCHPPDDMDIARREVLQQMCEVVNSRSNDKTNAIISAGTQDLPDAVRLALPKDKTMKRTIQRWRSKVHGKTVSRNVRKVKFLQSKYGNRLAWWKGHCYSYEALSRQNPDVSFWKCVKRKLECKARLHMKDEQVVSTFSQHCHPPDGTEIARRAALQQMYEAASTKSDGTQAILLGGTRDLPDAVRRSLPTDSSMKRTIQRWKSKGEGNIDVLDTTDQVNFVRSKRGRRLACVNDHCYSYEAQSKQDPGVTMWRCVKRKLNCKARVHLLVGQVVDTFAEHCHLPDSTDIARRAVIQKMCEAVSTKCDGTDAILSAGTKDLPDAVRLALPKDRTMKRTIQRWRSKVRNSIAVPNIT